MPTQSNKPKLTLTSFNKKEESERKNLTRLNLEETEHWELDDLKKNFEKVFQCKNIYHLRVLFSKEPHHVTTLLELLEKNNTITVFDLSYNRLSRNSGLEGRVRRRLDDKILIACLSFFEDWKDMKKLLRVDKTITELDLFGAGACPDNLGTLAKAFADNTTLEKRDLHDTYKFLSGVSALVKNLQRDSTLQTLCIGDIEKKLFCLL